MIARKQAAVQPRQPRWAASHPRAWVPAKTESNRPPSYSTNLSIGQPDHCAHPRFAAAQRLLQGTISTHTDSFRQRSAYCPFHAFRGSGAPKNRDNLRPPLIMITAGRCAASMSAPAPTPSIFALASTSQVSANPRCPEVEHVVVGQSTHVRTERGQRRHIVGMHPVMNRPAIRELFVHCDRRFQIE